MSGLTAACQRVYGAVEEICPRLQLPLRWGRVLSPTAVRVWSPELLSDLRSRFSDDELLQVGVLTADGQGGTALAAAFQGEQSAILPLRTKPEALPEQLVVGDSIYPQNASACLALLNDYRVLDLVGKGNGATFVVSTLQEVALLWSAGLPATVAAGLESLSVHGLRWLGQRVEQLALETSVVQHDTAHGIDATARNDVDGDDDSDEDDEDSDDDSYRRPPTLVLANWSVLELQVERVSWVPELVAHLEQAVEHCEDVELQYGIWAPSPKEMKRIGFCLQFGECSDVVQALLNSSQSLDHYLSDPAAPAIEQQPLSYAEAQAEWLSSLRRRCGFESINHSWLAVQEALERQFIAPFLALSELQTDPIAANRLILLAQVLRQVHLAWNRVAEADAKGGAAGTPLASPSRAEQMKQILTLQAQALLLMKEIASCPSKMPLRRLR